MGNLKISRAISVQLHSINAEPGIEVVRDICSVRVLTFSRNWLSWKRLRSIHVVQREHSQHALHTCNDKRANLIIQIFLFYHTL